MQTTRIAIVGAGLAGLYAAYSLEKRGIKDYVLLEAREILGGRIAGNDGFDLGPAWFWPAFQADMAQLVDELELETFQQFETGDMLLERSPNQPPERTRGYVNSPPSMRIAGGMYSLIDALYRRIDSARVVTGQAVRHLRLSEPRVELVSENANGETFSHFAEHVLLAMPPRLVESQLTFSPALPNELARNWRETDTWMAPHAKYIAVFDRPFWRDQGLSGEARSAVGPMVEIHDASTLEGKAALFGFLGVPADVRRRVSEEEIITACRKQFVRLFGSQAENPEAEFIKDWAKEIYTATDTDQRSSGDHPMPALSPNSGAWANRVTGIGSEWSREFTGYLAGAIDAVNRGLESF
ncbi:flavin monoamine oxidase family protein [Marinobacter sp. F4206]|uniref:flavin monoamine oxidase family protein n=1 Tax=Marinobacter sp. F4206 TaxID=2861777 RepID=UPI001C5E8651|nr:FAD-dependent oxidoreductase [Marinobacter sp. F4206]MBW4933044.1 FAD-dependent oxidoreductase [Marinobacter sp. F4206]